MARNRVIYQSEGLFASEEANNRAHTEHEQLRRVQSANYSFDIARQDVNQYGELARIDTLVLEAPTVSLDFSYYATDGFNERALGFYVTTGAAAEGGFASGHMAASSGRNFYIVTDAEGIDLNNTATVSGKEVIGIGNGYLSDYTVNAAVGDFPTASVSIEALNINSATANTGLHAAASTGTGIISPAINPTDGTKLNETYIAALPVPTSGIGATSAAGGIKALRPGDISMSFGGFVTGDGGPIADIDTTSSNSFNIQSFSMSVPLSRSPLQRLGTKFAFARTVDFPVVSTLSVSAIMNEATTASLVDIIDDEVEKDITVTINDSAGSPALKYSLKAATLASESFSSSIGANKAVDLTFTAQVGGPNDSIHGIFCSGVNSEAVFS